LLCSQEPLVSRTGPEPDAARPAAHDQAAAAPGAWSDRVISQAPQSPLQVSFTHPPALLRVAGVIDESTFGVFRRALVKAAMAGDRNLRVDLAGVEFCDLAGLRSIMSLAEPSGTGQSAVAQVTIAHLPDHLTEIMHILGWDTTPGVVVDTG
jgi:anti-anti-sigma regulatory factor